MTEPPLLSVGIPNYNHAEYLAEAVESVMEQSRPADEVIVVDDASTDDSPRVLDELERRYPSLEVIRHERNRGVLATVGEMLERSRGRYVFFAGADDRALPALFERSLGLLERHPEAAFCSSLSLLIDEHGRELGIFDSPVIARRAGYVSPSRARSALLHYDSWVMSNTLIYRKDVLLEAGGFRPELGAISDTFVALLMALRHGACFIPEPLGAWRRLDTGYASTSTRDQASYRKLIEGMATAMRTERPELFDERLVEVWVRRRLLELELKDATRAERARRKLAFHWRSRVSFGRPLRRRLRPRGRYVG
jgi:glycosyltransferase involved in cell wall biosynthesis